MPAIIVKGGGDMTMSVSPVTFRVRDASGYLGISEYLLRKLVQERKIAHIRAGKLILFRQDALDAFLTNSEQGTLYLEAESVHGIRPVPLRHV